MTSSGNETFLKEQYKVGSSYYSDCDQALIASIIEKNSTNAGYDIKVIRYWDFG